MLVELNENTKGKIFPSFTETDMAQTLLSMNESGTPFLNLQGNLLI